MARENRRRYREGSGRNKQKKTGEEARSGGSTVVVWEGRAGVALVTASKVVGVRKPGREGETLRKKGKEEEWGKLARGRGGTGGWESRGNEV